MPRATGPFFGSTRGAKSAAAKQFGESEFLKDQGLVVRTRRDGRGGRIKTITNTNGPVMVRKVRVTPPIPEEKEVPPPCRAYAYLAGDTGANDRYLLYPSGVEVGPTQTRETGSINWYSNPSGAFLSWAPGQRRHNQTTGVTTLYNKKTALKNPSTGEDLVAPIPFFGAAYSRAHASILIVGIENGDPAVYRIGARIDDCGKITVFGEDWTQVGTASWPTRAQDEDVATARGMYFNQAATKFVFSTTTMCLVQMDVTVDTTGQSEDVSHAETLTSSLEVAMQPKRRLLITRTNVAFTSSYCSGTEYRYKVPIEGDVNPSVMYPYGDYRYNQLTYMKEVYTRHYSEDNGATLHHMKRTGDNYRLASTGERSLSGTLIEKTGRYNSFGLTSGYAPTPYDGLFTITAEFINTPITNFAFSSASEDYNARENYAWTGTTDPPSGEQIPQIASTLCAGKFTGGQGTVGDDTPAETAGLMLYALDLRAGLISYYSPTVSPQNYSAGIAMMHTFYDEGWWLGDRAWFLARIGSGGIQFYRDPYYCWSTWEADWFLSEVDSDTTYDLTAEEFTLTAPFTFFTEEDSAYTGYTGWHIAHIPGSANYIIAGHIMYDDGVFQTTPAYLSQTFNGLQYGNAAFSVDELDYPRTILV